MKMTETKEIINFIEENSDKIITEIKFKNIEIYRFLKYQFRTTDVKENFSLFQRYYCEYYGLNKIGLTWEFKKENFSILEEYKNKKDFNFSDVLQRLYVIPNVKGQNTFQFSLTTRMLNMLDKDMLIYTNEVIKMFGFSRPSSALSFNKKFEAYMSQYEIVKDTYNEILNKNRLPKASLYFERKFKSYKVGKINKLNFIFQFAGKLKK
ncbi:hypothetical protein [Apibacter sp. HY039]|uniref:hypothetical protein n=1 Tax=Apibacter sp. HY039 TaxID=2501476 RepID=UPI000FEBA332|nr:hypothetical protein [Apibacter sp. HY039]